MFVFLFVLINKYSINLILKVLPVNIVNDLNKYIYRFSSNRLRSKYYNLPVISKVSENTEM